MALIPVLVAGGAGYIGSHIVRLLLQKGIYKVVVLDNLETGHIESIPAGVEFIKGDVRDTALLIRVFKEHAIQGVFHFCAYSLVSESMKNPIKYFDNNVGGAISLLKAMEECGVKHLVFSSTAATYGEPEHVPIKETDRTQPINPYGMSKLMIEQMIKFCPSINAIAFRYFNVAGAGFGVGEMHDNESHLIPAVIKRVMEGRPAVIFGEDYESRDGTCIRDYIHVVDLAIAHEMGFQYLLTHQGEPLTVINLGTQNGLSVKEIMSEINKLLPMKIEVQQRRPGDPAMLVADPTKAQELLGWKAEKSVEEIIQSAVDFHTKQESDLRAKK